MKLVDMVIPSFRGLYDFLDWNSCPFFCHPSSTQDPDEPHINGQAQGQPFNQQNGQQQAAQSGAPASQTKGKQTDVKIREAAKKKTGAYMDDGSPRAAQEWAAKAFQGLGTMLRNPGEAQELDIWGYAPPDRLY